MDSGVSPSPGEKPAADPRVRDPASSTPNVSDHVAPSPPGRVARRPELRRRTWVYATGVLVVVLALVGTFYVVSGDFHRSSPSATTVLVDRGTLYGLPAEQFNAVEVTVSGSVTLNGTVDNQFGFVLYQMTGAQVTKFAITGNLTKAGFEWTSGFIQSGATFYIDLPFPAGNWDLVFYNPATGVLNESYVGFVTDLVEEPS